MQCINNLGEAMEQITVFSNDLSLNQETKSKIQEIVFRALDRFNNIIRRVEVRLLDKNGPKGGVDKLCTLKVQHINNGKVVIKGEGISIVQAVHVASGIARNVLSKKHEKLTNHKPANRNKVVFNDLLTNNTIENRDES